MVDITTFRKIVDDTPDNISPILQDIVALGKYVDLLPSSSFQSSAVSEKLYETIRNCFASGTTIIWLHCKQLRNELILNHVIFNETLEPYLSILCRMQDALRKPPATPSLHNDWEKAITAAHDHVRLQSFGNSNLYVYARQFQAAKAARRLRDHGYKIYLKDGNVYLEETSELALTDKLGGLVQDMGGIAVAAQIFAIIKPRFDLTQKRYHLVRTFAPFGSVTEPACPFGYLLLLAIKHPFLPRSRPDIKAKWQQLIELSTDYAALCDVQPYNQYELMFKDGNTLVSFLQEIVLYDAFFTIPQMRSQDAIKIARGIFGWLDINKKLPCGCSIAEALMVAGKVFEIEPLKHEPICFNAKALAKKIDLLNPKQVSRILKRVFSHPIQGANQDFKKPTDVPGPDFFKRPLLALTNDHYCLIDKSACASSLIEALLAQLREVHPGLDDSLGAQLELFLSSELEKKGVTFCQGQYVSGGQNGECDLVIETSDNIIFLEIKKKPLTRKARAGSDIALLVDLAGSLLDAQLQTGWHEIRLRKAGYLDLHNKQSSCTRVSLKGRDVERIAVTLFDYGGLQDRMLLKQFLEAHLTLNFSTHHAQFHKKLSDLNAKVQKLREQTEALAQVTDSQRQPFFNCWFLSIPQLLVLLDDVTDNDSFKSALWNIRHMWTGSLDFYFDISNWKRINASPQCN